jgi:hypothetical protein
VLLAAKGLRTGLAPNLRASVGALLVALGVDREFLAREIAAIEPMAFSRATNRHVLGSMNDLAFQASVHITRVDDLLAISRRLAETPMSAIGPKRGDLEYSGIPEFANDRRSIRSFIMATATSRQV